MGTAWPKIENTMQFRVDNRALPENDVWAPELDCVKSLAPWLRERQKWHAVFSCAGALKTSRANCWRAEIVGKTFTERAVTCESKCSARPGREKPFR